MKNTNKRNKISRKLIIGLIAISTLLCFAGCEWVVTILTQPYGKVIDAKTGEGVSGVTVKLTFDNTDATSTDKENVAASGYYTTTTTATGSYSTADVPYGTYTLSAEKTGYVFFDREVTISGTATNIGTTLGVESTVADTDISFILLWDDDFHDCDAYLTYPAKGENTTDGTAPTFVDPYSAPTAHNTAGFSPDTFTGTAGPIDVTDTSETIKDRMKVYYQRPSTAVDSSNSFSSTTYENTLDKGEADFDADDDGTAESYYIELDVDATLGGGPETITVRAFPWADNGESVNTNPTDENALPESVTYAWVGVMEYYVDAYENEYGNTTATNNYLSANSGSSSVSADAVLYVLQGTTLLGKYTVPEYNSISTASLVRVNCFWNSNDASVYQIIPDLRVLQTTDGVKSITDSDGIITVTGLSR